MYFSLFFHFFAPFQLNDCLRASESRCHRKNASCNRQNHRNYVLTRPHLKRNKNKLAVPSLRIDFNLLSSVRKMKWMGSGSPLPVRDKSRWTTVDFDATRVLCVRVTMAIAYTNCIRLFIWFELSRTVLDQLSFIASWENTRSTKVKTHKLRMKRMGQQQCRMDSCVHRGYVAWIEITFEFNCDFRMSNRRNANF